MPLKYEFQAQDLISAGKTSEKNVKKINQWLKSASLPDLPKEMIVLFLISCDNDLRRVQNTIDIFFKVRSQTPEMFDGRDVDNDEVKKITKVLAASSFPKRLGNTVILFFRLIDFDYRNFVLRNSLKYSLMTVDASQRSNPPDDIIAILDFEGMTFMHLTCVRINLIKNLMEYVQYGMPLKIKKVHVLNVNYLAAKVVAIVKLFLGEQLADALEIHPPGMKMEEFHEKWVPASHLPKEYGGELPSYHELNEITIKEFQEMKEFFRDQEEIVLDYISKKDNQIK